MVTGVVPFPPRFLSSILIPHRVQQSHCSSVFHRVLQTQALALFPSQLVHKKKFSGVYTSMHEFIGVCTIFYEYARGGARTHETVLHQGREYPDMLPGRPDGVTTTIDCWYSSCTQNFQATNINETLSKQLDVSFDPIV